MIAVSVRVLMNEFRKKYVIGHTIFSLPLVILAHWLQILEDMEREFGISCPSGLPKDQYQEDILDLETCDSQEELERSQSIISQKEEEKSKVGDALLAGIRRNLKMPKT